MSIRKAFGLVLILIMMVSLLAGCGNGDKESQVPDQKQKIVIGVTYDYIADFMAYVYDGTKAYADEHDDVEVIIFDANFDVAAHLQHVENFISQKVDAVLMKPTDKDATQPITDLLKAAGIPFVVTNSPVNSAHDSYIGSDNALAGRIQMEEIAKLLNGKGKVAILVGDPNNEASHDRTDGNKEIIAKYPDIEIVAEQTGGWMRDQGMRLTENWLQSGLEIDAIIANNDEMAIGAALAVKESGKNILVAGIDATPDALNYMKEGLIAVTVFQNGFMQGYIGVQTAVKLARGEKVPAYIDVPFELVTPDKADRYLALYK